MNPHEKSKIASTTETEKFKAEKEAFTSVVRVLERKCKDISDEENEKVMGDMEKIFKNQRGFKEKLLNAFGGKPENIPDKFLRTIFYERNKTSEELELIRIANEETNELRKKFNLPTLNIDSDNIYVIPEDAPWPEGFEGKSYHAMTPQFIAVQEKIIEKPASSRTVFMMMLLHELIEFKSYVSIINNGDLPLDVYKHGLKIYQKGENDEPYFNKLNEAIVEELAIRIFDKLKNNQLLKNEVAITNQIKENLVEEKDSKWENFKDDDTYFIGVDYKNSIFHWSGFSSLRERKILSNLIDKIYNSKKNTGKFESREEVFDVFAEAVMTGNIVPLGRLVDKTFNKKTFHNIAEISNNTNELEKYIRELE